MKKSIWIVLIALAAGLSGCATGPESSSARTKTAHAQERWNGGVWNSVLGYNGPANMMAGEVGGP